MPAVAAVRKQLRGCVRACGTPDWHEGARKKNKQAYLAANMVSEQAYTYGGGSKKTIIRRRTHKLTLQGVSSEFASRQEYVANYNPFCKLALWRSSKLGGHVQLPFLFQMLCFVLAYVLYTECSVRPSPTGESGNLRSGRTARLGSE